MNSYNLCVLEIIM